MATMTETARTFIGRHALLNADGVWGRLQRRLPSEYAWGLFEDVELRIIRDAANTEHETIQQHLTSMPADAALFGPLCLAQHALEEIIEAAEDTYYERARAVVMADPSLPGLDRSAALAAMPTIF